MPAPIGFSECLPHDINATYFIEWLGDNQSFPSLSSSSIVQESQDMQDWQIIGEKEIDQANQGLSGLTIKSITLHNENDRQAVIETEFWEHIDYATFQPPRSYAMIATNAQNQLAYVQQLYPFPPIHPHLTHHTSIEIATRPDAEEPDTTDDWYHLYAEHKSHGSHSHFGNKNYMERQRKKTILDIYNNSWRCVPPEITQRILYQNITMRTHAKQYKPPGPRNANKNKLKNRINLCERLIKLPYDF